MTKIVRQAHMPGNYELDEPGSNKIGTIVCKDCWENASQQTTSPLDTVWISLNGYSMIWWLCPNHTQKLQNGKTSKIQLIKSVRGIVKNPAL
jgi:hypothetical protein